MIEARGLTRTSGPATRQSRPCVASTSTSGKGELVAFLGPNGAGKSTTLRMLTTLLQPTAARPAWSAATSTERSGRRAPPHRLHRPGQRRRPQPARAATSWSPRAAATASGRREAAAPRRGPARRRSTSAGSATARSAACPAASGAASTSPSAWSTARGCCSSTSRPPASTPRTGPTCQSQIERLRADHGTTIVLTTHYLDEADAMADRVVVIDHGDRHRRRHARAAQGRAGRRPHRHHRPPTPADAAVVARRCRAHRRRRRGAGPSGAVVTARVRGGATLVPGLLRDLDRAGRRRGGRRGQPAHPRRRVPRAHRPQPPRSRRGASPAASADPRPPTADGAEGAADHRHARPRPPGEGIVSNTLAHRHVASSSSRELRPMRRNPFSLIFTLVQPLVFLALFGPLLPQVSGFDDGHVAAVVRARHRRDVGARSRTSMTGSNLQLEMQTGAHERHAGRAAAAVVAAGRPGAQGDRARGRARR